jgi:hypothetical protein
MQIQTVIFRLVFVQRCEVASRWNDPLREHENEKESYLYGHPGQNRHHHRRTVVLHNRLCIGFGIHRVHRIG